MMPILDTSMRERIRAINDLARVEMTSDAETRRVEIIMLTFKQPEVEVEAAKRIIENTEHPYKLVLYDNRPNSANTSRIWNKLIRESTCEYVLLIDSDAFVPKTSPCWLTRMMESIDETGIVIPVGDNVGGAHQKQSGALPYGTKTINRDIWSGYCFLVKKSVFDKVGYFDEQFYIYGQDSEWAFRSKNRGAVMRQDVFVAHKGSYSFMKEEEKGAVDREADKVRARILYKKKTKNETV
jgi:hypothetical protein